MNRTSRELPDVVLHLYLNGFRNTALHALARASPAVGLRRLRLLRAEARRPPRRDRPDAPDLVRVPRERQPRRPDARPRPAPAAGGTRRDARPRGRLRVAPAARGPAHRLEGRLRLRGAVVPEARQGDERGLARKALRPLDGVLRRLRHLRRHAPPARRGEGEGGGHRPRGRGDGGIRGAHPRPRSRRGRPRLRVLLLPPLRGEEGDRRPEGAPEGRRPPLPPARPPPLAGALPSRRARRARPLRNVADALPLPGSSRSSTRPPAPARRRWSTRRSSPAGRPGSPPPREASRAR